MEMTSRIFEAVLSPLAIVMHPDPASSCSFDEGYRFPEEEEEVREQEEGGNETAGEWRATDQNPQSRDGLASCSSLFSEGATATWRIDGADFDGRRFFAVPTFAIGKPPLRVDVYIPPFEDIPPDLRRRLRPEAVLSNRRSDLANLPITRHLLRALETWSARLPNFQREYESLPFGSQILVGRIDADVEVMAADMHLYPSYDVEENMLTPAALKDMWQVTLPQQVDLEDVKFQSQLHEAISLVTIRSTAETNPDTTPTTFVFKSLLRDQRYMYNEFKNLITLPSHPNIVPTPPFTVTKRARFGGRRGVIGFILPYYPLGSLKQYLLSTPPIPLETKIEWCQQITRALIHINSYGCFYPDLKPDNVVLWENDRKLDAVLIDLEQRGGWYSWSPPEVGYVEYLELLASAAPEQNVRDEYGGLVKRRIPKWKVTSQQDRYVNLQGGFSMPWKCLKEEEREKAQVFMLGKLIWCVFEVTPWVRCGIDHEVLRDEGSGVGFPVMGDEVPRKVRELVKACTNGAREWERGVGGVLKVEGRNLVVRGGGDVGVVTKEWWAEEVRKSKEFVEGGKGWERPTFEEVLRVLEGLGGDK
ncbi:hypothetical protein OQA88_1845 [Cercophora sp. LCS_1]